ncbi:MAG: hypothetical protein WC307_05100 [Candidatus Nanoarchaeia archaeon]|jgi:hypothetical protein
MKLIDCDLCISPFYPSGKCPEVKWKNCSKRKRLMKIDSEARKGEKKN